ncbi:hypothetical protein CC86DRAFT_132345 [Ophiobolus disseminans]|uniref:Integral membrane protein-like protein n=1 Tax=Ophiobolus disseminans TaxID=1469910 RepID=A0A6A6ZFI8_9PLEO|nr:hypothetical protein CC86DRAFT_132345 [Ophiobolus disseminans]
MPLTFLPSLSQTAITTLRILPLLSTTASLTHAYMELITVSAFLHAAPTRTQLSKFLLKGTSPTPTPTPAARKELQKAKTFAAPAWFVNFFNVGVWSVIGLNSLTLLSASANLWLYPENLGASRVYYLIGLGAALGHYAFVPLVGASVERLFALCAAQERGEDAGAGKGAVESVREWVGVHKVRMGSVDVVAWGSFVVGVVGVLGA